MSSDAGGTGPSDLDALSLHDALPIFQQGQDQNSLDNFRIGQLKLQQQAQQNQQQREAFARIDKSRMELSGVISDTIEQDRKSTRLNSSHPSISYADFCLKIKTGNLHE